MSQLPAASTGGAAAAPAPAARPPAVRLRYKLTIAYDGTLFHGWQKQTPPEGEPLRTVAGVVEDRLIHTLGQPIALVGASRTDAGVHARGQVAHFDAATRIPTQRLAEAVNSRLPQDVEIVEARVVPDSFDAIRSVTSKQYRYRLYNTTRRPLEQRHAVYHCWTPLDTAAMADAARRLVGQHDFAGFAAADHGRLSTVRTIHDCHIETEKGTEKGDRTHFSVSSPVPTPEVHIVVSGDGFLYNMVRIIAGTLVEVGRRRLGPGVIDEVFKTNDRRHAGPTLPPTDLWLEWIRYGEE